MTTELETTPMQVVSPSGEVLSLDSPTEDLATWLAEVREHESLLRETKRAVTQELLARMDKLAHWTINAAGLKLTGQSPAVVEEWDGAELRTALLELFDNGTLSIEAVDAAVEQVTTWKPKKAGINALRKLPHVAPIIEGLRQEREPDRRVTVSRS